MRNTRQREEILDFLRSKREHYTAVQIYDAVRQKIPDISLGTVYRNLGKLVESGEIVTVGTEDKSLCYDGFLLPHDHFVCTECKKIFDLELKRSEPKGIISSGFEIQYGRTVYYGICPECKKSKIQ